MRGIRFVKSSNWLFLRFSVLLLLSLWAGSVSAQTTQFTYQGKLGNGGAPANGSYDFQFKLFDTSTVGTGTQQGATLTLSSVAVTGGIFSAGLDFGACATCFDGTNRFLEIAVTTAGGATFTTLSPRQPITSTPYALKSLNAAAADGLSVACVNCVTSSQIQSVDATVLSGTLPVSSIPAGSSNYIQNATSQQAGDFNISGNGTAGGALSAGQFNFAGNRVLGISGGATKYLRSNLFVGVDTGTDTTPAVGDVFGNYNSFAGTGAGRKNTTGSENSFFGAYAGYNNLTGQGNSYFGDFTGNSTTSGINNSFFGSGAGYSNTIGGSNAFFGQQSGNSNVGGNDNSFFGTRAGLANQSGTSNSFFGRSAGQLNTTGSSSSMFGAGAGFNTTGGFNNFFGAGAAQSNVAGDNNSFFGYITGFKNTTGTQNTFLGNISGYNNITGNHNVMLGYGSDFRDIPGTTGGTTSGDGNLFLGYQAGGAATRRNSTAIGTNAYVACDDCTVVGDSTVSSYKVGVGTNNPSANLHISSSSTAGTSLVVDNSTASSSGITLSRYGSAGAGPYFSSGASVDSANTSSLYVPSLFVLRAGGGLMFSGSGTTQHMNITTSGHVYPGFDGAQDLGSPSLKWRNVYVGGSLTVGTSSPSAQLTVDAGGESVYAHSTNGYGLHARSETTDAAYFEGSTHFTRWITLDELRTGGIGTGLCLNSSNQISNCSSSLRYKTNVESFRGGLNIVNRLRPITFNWKEGGAHDLGFAAEEVADVEPLLAFRNKTGEIEGVKYGQLSAVFVNAFKEQQTQIQKQQDQLEQLRAEIELLKQYVCAASGSASSCPLASGGGTAAGSR
jgi:hypothetical protein